MASKKENLLNEIEEIDKSKKSQGKYKQKKRVENKVGIHDIEEIPRLFRRVCDELSIPGLHTNSLISWRIGISDQFIDQMLLPALKNTNKIVLAILQRPIWLGTIKKAEVPYMGYLDMPQYGDLKERLNQDQRLPLYDSSQFLTIYGVKNQQEISQILERLSNDFNVNSDELVVLVDVIGPFEDCIKKSLRLLMVKTSGSGLAIWVHAELHHIPNDLLDQFRNYIIFFPTLSEVTSLEKVQRYYNGKDGNLESLDVALLAGPCVSTIRSWVTIDLHLYASEAENLSKVIKGVFFMSPQDIVPFVPVIVEATKFFFDQVSTWIADVRKRANIVNANSSDKTLNITEERLAEAYNKSASAIVELISTSVTADQIDRARSLKEQIKIAYDVLSELEKQELTATGVDQAKLNVQIKMQAETISQKVDNLQSVLRQIYKQSP